MDHTNRKAINADTAAKLAEALAAAGIESDVPETEPNPHMGVYHAFWICRGGQNAKALREWKERLDAPSPEYYREAAKYCHRALRRHDMPEEFIELVTFSWGYFLGLLKGSKTPSQP